MGERIHLHMVEKTPFRYYSITENKTVRHWKSNMINPDILFEVTGQGEPTGKYARRIKNSKYEAEIL